MRVDLHTHTSASGDAFCTIVEMAQYARTKTRLEGFAITDHGPAGSGLSLAYFANLPRINNRQREFCPPMQILTGCEANVMDLDGSIDIPLSVQRTLDVVIVGLHHLGNCPQFAKTTHTELLIWALQQNIVHVIAHPHTIKLNVNLPVLFEAATEAGTLLEINLATLAKQKEHTVERIKLMIDLAKEHQTKIVLVSGAHFMTELGDDSILKNFPEIELPDNLILGQEGGMTEVQEFLRTYKEKNAVKFV